ncbi:prepilin-type N-terminal cleavage/methylation domain-containing protein [Galenea microaerophila]
MSIQKQKGFTLVEIAIVLVIIGLLLGGVLKGQELIKSAKVKSEMQQIDGITAAINTYQDRFGYLPGDDPGASNRLGTDPNHDGNGNGTFSNAEGNQYIWEHMAAAGLLGGYQAAPNGRLLNKYGMQTYVRTNFAGLSGTVVCTLLPNEVAREIDQKRDDGNGATGSMRRDDQTDYPTTAGNSWICVSAS